MKQIVRRGTNEFEILAWSEHREHEVEPLDRFGDMPAALGFLHSLLHDHTNMMALRRALAGEAFYPRMSLLTDHDVVQEIAWRLVSGALRVIALPLPPAVAVQGEAAESDEEEPEEPAVIDEERHWIDFKVIDDATEEPVTGVTLRIKLPGGIIRNFPTNPEGLIEIRDIDDGKCDILQMRDAEGLEVVSVE